LFQERPDVLSPAGTSLRDEFRELYSSGNVRAPTLVRLAWRIRQAGDQAAAAVQDLAVDPSTPGFQANSARLLHNRFGYSRQEEHLYRLPVPVETHDGRRITMFPLIPPHEAVAAAYANNPAQFLVGERDVSPDFVLHPLTRAYGTNATFPLQIFVDAAGFTKRDSFVSYLMSFVYPGSQRFCLAVVRKAELCSCGCRGHHTLELRWFGVSGRLPRACGPCVATTARPFICLRMGNGSPWLDNFSWTESEESFWNIELTCCNVLKGWVCRTIPALSIRACCVGARGTNSTT
jgi:hypothetical protein